MHNSRGQVAVMVAVLAPVALLFLGLVLDVGLALHYKGQLQNAADAAALAGAVGLKRSTPPEDEVHRAVVANPIGHAPAVVESFGYSFDSVDVLLVAERPTLVGGFLGIRTWTIRAAASARLDDDDVRARLIRARFNQ